MAPYDPISALEKREAEKEQNCGALKVSIILGVMSFMALFCSLVYKGLGLH